MKKVLIIFIIFSLIFNNFLVHFTLAQDETDEETKTSVDLSPYKLSCNLEKIEIEEITPEATETIEYTSELEGFAGKFGEKGTGFLQSLFQGLLADIAIGVIQDFITSLLGKVPVGAAETNNAIATSIKESTKNVLASIRTSIQLAIKDSLEYLKFQLINKVNEIIYGKILKNFIPNLEAYKNFRLFTAYQRAYNKAFLRYKTLPCLPKELKDCLEALLGNSNQIGINFAKNAENSSKLIRFINAFHKLQRLEILEKRECEDYELEQVYTILGLTNPKPQTYSGYKPPEAYVAKLPKEKIPGSFANIFNNFKNIFGKINLKRLTAQIAPDFVPKEGSFNIYFDIYEPLRTQINVGNCLTLNDRFLTQVMEDLTKEEERLNVQIQQPGGVTFKPKTRCLKTWTQVEYEETMKALAEAMEKGDMTKIEMLDKKREELKTKIENEKEISGEDPNCLIPGPTLSSPSTYEELKKQILTSPLEFFKSQERATNVLVAFVRSWLASKLFKIIDKGFASLEAKSSSNYYYLSDIKKAYDMNRIEKICSEMESTAIPKIKESCKASLESQRRKIFELEQKNVTELREKILKVFQRIRDLQTRLEEFDSSTTALQNELQNYTQFISEEKLSDLSETLNNLTTIKEDFENISQIIAGSTSSLEQFSNNELLEEIASVTKDYEEKIQALDADIQKIRAYLENIQREAQQKLASAFNLSGLITNKISNFFSDYFDLEKNPLTNPKDFIGYINSTGGYEGIVTGEDPPKYHSCSPSLDKKIRLSFFSDFYPTRIKNCLYSYTYEQIEERFDKSEVEIKVKTGTDWKKGAELFKDGYHYSIYFIIHDLIYIFYSLYNVPATKTGIQQENFLYATYNFLTNLISGNIKVSQNLENEINQLYEYFDALEKYTLNTIQYAKDKWSDSRYKIEFLITKEKVNWNAGADNILKTVDKLISSNKAIKLRLGEVLDFLLTTSKGFKEAIEVYKNAIQADNQFVQNIQRIQQLEERKKGLVNELNSKIDVLWSQIINMVNPEELQNISNSIDQNLEKINDNIEDLNNLCEAYNNLIEEIENEINEKMKTQQETQPELPPEEPSSQIKIRQPVITAMQRIFGITKGIFANIFSVFNIFKPKKIYIK